MALSDTGFFTGWFGINRSLLSLSLYTISQKFTLILEPYAYLAEIDEQAKDYVLSDGKGMCR